jgi:tetratricopeptide (TPR) repeat protein
MIVVYEIYFAKQRPRVWRLALLLALLLLIPLMYKFNATSILGREFASRSHDGDYLYWLTYALTQFPVIVKYIQLILVPVGQNFDYDFPAVYSLMEPAAFACFAAVIALMYMTLRLYDKHRLVSFCLAWFFVTLSVESSIITLPHVIFEHRLYLPMAGVAILVTDTFFRCFQRKKVSVTFIAVLIAMYAALTIQRNAVWKDGITLWSDVIKKSPNKSRPYHNRGFHYLEKREYAKALEDFNRAIELEPRYLQAYNNRATAYRALGLPLKALKDYGKAIELSDKSAGSWHNRGQLLAEMGHADLAMADFARAIAVNPDYFLAPYNRGRLHAQLKDYPSALADLSRALELKPDFSYAYAERGKVYLYLNEDEKALDDFTQCLKIRQNDANCLNNRAIIFSRLALNGQEGNKYLERALEDMDRVIELEPKNGAALLNRSLVFLALKEYPLALEDALAAENNGFSVDKTYLRDLKALAHEMVLEPPAPDETRP